MSNTQLIFDILIATTAVIGATLGIFNFIHQRQIEKSQS